MARDMNLEFLKRRRLIYEIQQKENSMHHLEALNIVLATEKEAVKLYKKLSIEHTAIRELFEFLMNEEEKHVRLIEKKISELYK